MPWIAPTESRLLRGWRSFLMRVLHVTDCYLPRVGGIELHVRDLATRQSQRRDHAEILTLTPRAIGDPADPEWVHRVSGSDPHPAGLTRSWTQLERALRATRPDVVHVHVSVVSPFSTMAAYIAGRLRIPTLITVHSVWTRLGPLPALAQGTMRLREWPVTWSAVSSVAASPVQEMLGCSHRVHVLPNAVDLAEWAKPHPPVDSRTGAASGPLTILSVMRLTRVKRALPLAAMLGKVREQTTEIDARAVIIGDGPQRARMERYLQRHHLQDWVTITGRLDRDAIRIHLDQASLFWAPAELESFGIAPLEARTHGLPVVASSHSGVGEYITHGVEGLLGAKDADMVTHVVDLLTDESLRRRIAHHNTSVPPHHDWDEACRRTDELYRVAALRLESARSITLPGRRS
ncbi:MAG: glycosyltransferase family 4 protein [Ornithinibacter sp.]